MQSSWCVCAAAAAAVLGAAFASGQAAAGPAPQFRSEAKLVNASAASRDESIAGVHWTCDGEACTGVAERRANLDGPVRECKKVVAVLGPVASYRTGPRELTRGQVEACNRGAPGVETAAK